MTYDWGEPNPEGHEPVVKATGDQPAGVVSQGLAGIEQGPQLPVASQVSIAPALHVAALPHERVEPGRHVPEHVPSVQSWNAQSEAAPHGVPSGQLGAHEGAAQVPCVHDCDAQSAFAPHAAPSAHEGEQAGGAHVPP